MIKNLIIYKFFANRTFWNDWVPSYDFSNPVDPAPSKKQVVKAWIPIYEFFNCKSLCLICELTPS